MMLRSSMLPPYLPSSNFYFSIFSSFFLSSSFFFYFSCYVAIVAFHRKLPKMLPGKGAPHCLLVVASDQQKQGREGNPPFPPPSAQVTTTIATLGQIEWFVNRQPQLHHLPQHCPFGKPTLMARQLEAQIAANSSGGFDCHHCCYTYK